jgi:hypothetical protein
MILLVIAIASLLVGLSSAIAYFQGSFDQGTYRSVLLGATLVWFVFATLWAYRKPKSS